MEYGSIKETPPPYEAQNPTPSNMNPYMGIPPTLSNPYQYHPSGLNPAQATPLVSPLTGSGVVIHQPGFNPRSPGTTVANLPRNWSTELSDCCLDTDVCLMTAFCPAGQACMLATDLEESACVPFCVPGWLITLRTKFRTQHNIMGSVLDDCCTVFWCGSCVMCQLAREINLTKKMVAQ